MGEFYSNRKKCDAHEIRCFTAKVLPVMGSLNMLSRLRTAFSLSCLAITDLVPSPSVTSAL